MKANLPFRKHLSLRDNRTGFYMFPFFFFTVLSFAGFVEDYFWPIPLFSLVGGYLLSFYIIKNHRDKYRKLEIRADELILPNANREVILGAARTFSREQLQSVRILGVGNIVTGGGNRPHLEILLKTNEGEMTYVYNDHHFSLDSMHEIAEAIKEMAGLVTVSKEESSFLKYIKQEKTS